MKHIVYILVFTQIFSTALFSRDLKEIKRSGKLYVGITPNTLKSINYPLAIEFAKFLNLELVPVMIEWNEAFSQNGIIPHDIETNPAYSYTPDALKKADIICNTFTVVEWRKKLFDFAETLYSAEILLVHEDVDIPLDYEALKGLRIAYMEETSFGSHIQTINEKIGGGIKLRPMAATDEAKDLILKKQVEGIILDADDALNFRKEHNNRFHLAFPITKISKTAWVVKKGHQLQEEIENFFYTIDKNGVLDKIFFDRFGIKYSAFVKRIHPHGQFEINHRDLDEILASHKIVVALRERDFIYHEKGNKQFMHLLAEEFASYLGVQLEFVLTPSFSKYWETSDEKIVKDSVYTPEIFHYFDVACEMIVPLPWRTSKVDLVNIYPSKYEVIAQKETPLKTLQDLKKLRGVTSMGTAYEEFLLNHGIDSFYYANINELVDEVVKGKADYTVIFNAFLAEGLEPKLSLGSVDVCWALRKDQPKLKKELEKFFEHSRKGGLLKILEKAQQGKALSIQNLTNIPLENFQTGENPLAPYQISNDIIQEEVHAIFQENNGTMWFGTQSGAIRYQEGKIDLFNTRNGLNDNTVYDIKQDRQGWHYFATSRGVTIMKADSSFHTIFPDVTFHGIRIDPSGQKWLLGDDGTYLIRPDGQKYRLNDTYGGLPDMVYTVSGDTSGKVLFMASPEGLYVHMAGTRPFNVLDDYCYSVYIDSTDSLWLSTKEGIFINHFREVMKGKKGRKLNDILKIPDHIIIKKIEGSPSGSIYLISDNHVYKVHAITREATIPEMMNDRKDQTIRSCFEDNEGNIWIAFSQGLKKLVNPKNLLPFHPKEIGKMVFSLKEDSKGRVWIGTNEGIFYVNEKLVNFSNKIPSSNGKFLVDILPNENILIANIEGIYEFDIYSLNMVNKNKRQVLKGLETIFISENEEIFLRTEKSGEIYYYKNFHSNPRLIKPEETPGICPLINYNNEIIGGCKTGLVRFDGKKFNLFYPLDRPVKSLCYHDNVLWIGMDNGIGYYYNHTFHKLPLPKENMEVQSIIPAKNRNYLWIGTNKGLFYFNKENYLMEPIGNEREKVTENQFSGNKLLIDQKGSLWIGTPQGIFTYNLFAPKEDYFFPNCFLEKIILNEETVNLTKGQKFAYHQNNFLFEVSTTSFSNVIPVEYEFYMKSQKNSYHFIQRGKDPRAIYSNLPPGDYEFIYRAKMSDDTWTYSQGWPFKIGKPLWSIRGVQIIFLLLTGFLLWKSYKWKVHQVKEQKKMLETELKNHARELEETFDKTTKLEHTITRLQMQMDRQQEETTNQKEYTHTILTSFMPDKQILTSLFTEHFVLHNPLDIASGDFYWLTEQKDSIIVALADCTGHGIRGAWMSALGINLLHEIVNQSGIIQPHEILNKLRKSIIKALQQEKGSNTNEGMNISICTINKSEKTVEFAGANQSIFFVANRALKEIKGDHMPASAYAYMDPFNVRRWSYQEGDLLYMFSDGFANQFGGNDAKKFKKKTFRELIQTIHEKSFKEQKHILDKTFTSWKGNNEQVDDVTVVGLKV